MWLRARALDDAADLIQDAPRRKCPYLLASLDLWPRAEVSSRLAHQDGEAGGLMSPHFARFRSGMEMDKAISYLRRQAGQAETTHDFSLAKVPMLKGLT